MNNFTTDCNTHSPCSRAYFSVQLMKIWEAVHKVRHAVFFTNFDPFPLSHFVTHLGPPIFLQNNTKRTRIKNLYKITRNCSWGLCPGIFVWKVLSGVVLSVPLLSENIHYNRKLNITFNFGFHMYDTKIKSVTSHALDSSSVTNCHTFSDPSRSSVTYFMGGPCAVIKSKCAVVALLGFVQF